MGIRVRSRGMGVESKRGGSAGVNRWRKIQDYAPCAGDDKYGSPLRVDISQRLASSTRPSKYLVWVAMRLKLCRPLKYPFGPADQAGCYVRSEFSDCELRGAEPWHGGAEEKWEHKGKWHWVDICESCDC